MKLFTEFRFDGIHTFGYSSAES